MHLKSRLDLNLHGFKLVNWTGLKLPDYLFTIIQEFCGQILLLTQFSPSSVNSSKGDGELLVQLFVICCVSAGFCCYISKQNKGLNSYFC